MQTRTETISAMPAYPFLSQPPQDHVPQSQNARRRSLAAISNWASSVQPGAPAPISPTTKGKFVEPAPRPAEIRAARRHSVKPTPAPPPPIDYLPESPSSSDQSVTPTTKPDFKGDLKTGYTVFVALPPTPTTPTTPSRKGLSRLRGLSIKPSSRSKPSAETSHPSSSSSGASASKDKVKEKKKSKYDDARPAQLATDLALAQLMGGGSIEHHIRQAAEKEAKRAGAKKVNGQYVGVGAVHRDNDGRVWRDQDEEWEYTHLLGREAEGAENQEWVRFSEDSSRTSPSVDNHERSRHHTKSKRRPEPLDLAPSRPHGSSRRGYSVDQSDAHHEFLQSSFTPAPGAMASNASLDVSSKRSGLKLNMKGMFKKSSH